jgi:hypothetical protein
MLMWTPVAGDACEGLLEAASNHSVPPRTFSCLPPLCEAALNFELTSQGSRNVLYTIHSQNEVHVMASASTTVPVADRKVRKAASSWARQTRARSAKIMENIVQPACETHCQGIIPSPLAPPLPMLT